MREVILRKKEERRIQTVQRLGGPISINDQKSVRQLNRNDFDERRIQHSRRMDEEHSNRRKFDSKTRKTSGIRNGRKEPVSGANSEASREVVNSGRLKAAATTNSSMKKMESAAVGNDPSVEQTVAGATTASSTSTSIRRAKRENEQNPERSRKKKAYLAVLVNSLNQAPINVDRIRIIAETVGPTKVLKVLS